MAHNVFGNWRRFRRLAGSRFWIARPLKRQIDDAARDLDAFQRCQGGAQHGQLTSYIARLAQRASQWIFNRRDARRADCLRQRQDRGQDDSGKPGGFDFALYQSNGPAADRSGRHQHHHIGPLSAQIVDNGRRSLFQQRLGLEDIAPHGEMLLGRSANLAQPLQLLQTH